MRALGASAVVRMCEEVTWGVTPVAPAIVYGVPLRSETLGSTKNLFESEVITDKRCTTGLGDGNQAIAGNIVTDFFPEGLETLIKHLLCDDAITTTGSGPYVHTIKGKPGFMEGLSIEKGFPSIGQYLKYSGCRINSMTLNVIQEGFHDVTFDFMGKREDTSTSTMIVGTPVYADKDGYTGYQCVVASTINGSGVVTPGVFTDMGFVVSGSMTINNNIDTTGYVLGSPYRAAADLGKRTCNGNFTIFFEDLNVYNIYKSGELCSIRFTFDNTFGQKLVVTFHQVKIGGESPKIAGIGGVNLPLTFQSKYDTTALTDVTFEITNTLPSIA